MDLFFLFARVYACGVIMTNMAIPDINSRKKVNLDVKITFSTTELNTSLLITLITSFTKELVCCIKRAI
jgi:hypothetical protein